MGRVSGKREELVEQEGGILSCREREREREIMDVVCLYTCTFAKKDKIRDVGNCS